MGEGPDQLRDGIRSRVDRAFRRGRRLATCCLLVAGFAATSRATTAQQQHPLSDPSLRPKIHQSIDLGIEHLIRAQHRDGSWTGHAFRSYPSGPTAFAAFALVESGVPVESPSIQMALRYLREHPPQMTYSAGALLLLLAEIGGEDNLDWAQRTLDQLVEWESTSLRGAWSYPSGPIDLSNTQFVALGFWAADRLGLTVPIQVTKRMVQTTIKSHQEEAWTSTMALVDEKRPNRKPKRRKIAGFTYFVNGDRWPPSGSMTTAGIGVQRIARKIHGKKLGGKLLGQMDKSEALAMGWLAQHWSTDENHQHPDGQLLFHLYSIERLGGFLETDLFFGHPWYEDGARKILDLQEPDGGWGRLHQTDYALLFLARASGPNTSQVPEATRKDFKQLADGPVHLAAHGRMQIVAWITDLDVEKGTQVEQVIWTVNGDARPPTIAQQPGVWKGERFPIRWSSTGAQEVTLVANVHVIHPDGAQEIITSDPLQLTCTWTGDEWMERAARVPAGNLISETHFEIEASGESAGHAAARAVDGFEGTAWLARSGDEVPRLTIKFQRSVTAEFVTLSHPASSVATIGQTAGAQRVRITINGKAAEHEIPPQSPEVLALPLGKRTRIKTLVVELLAFDGQATALRGIAELGLR